MSNALPLFGPVESRHDIVAANVRGYAARAGFSQSALARALGLHQSAVSDRWRGVRKWNLDELDAVAAIVGVSIFDLIASEEEKLNPRQWITPTGAAARSKGLEPPTFWLVARSDAIREDSIAQVIDLQTVRARRAVA